jgi:hypothetical protein
VKEIIFGFTVIMIYHISVGKLTPPELCVFEMKLSGV